MSLSAPVELERPSDGGVKVDLIKAVGTIILQEKVAPLHSGVGAHLSSNAVHSVVIFVDLALTEELIDRVSSRRVVVWWRIRRADHHVDHDLLKSVDVSEASLDRR